jgi:hypothetical protein
MSADGCVEEQRIGIRRLEFDNIEGLGNVIRENTLADADRTIKRIIVEKVAATARYQRCLVSKCGERVGKAVMKPAHASLKQKVGT